MSKQRQALQELLPEIVPSLCVYYAQVLANTSEVTPPILNSNFKKKKKNLVWQLWLFFIVLASLDFNVY